jgi:hypothetical protein
LFLAAVNSRTSFHLVPVKQMNHPYRSPNAIERALLERLLEQTFSGRDELSKQLDGLCVKTIDQAGSLSLRPAPSAVPAEVKQRVVAEGHYSDEDESSNEGPQVRLLLHVVKGLLVELEIYKDDGLPIKKTPRPEDLVLG